MAKPAAQPAHHRHRQVDQRGGDAAPVHQLARKDKQRHRQQEGNLERPQLQKFSRVEQHRIHRRLIISVLRAEMLSEDSGYEWIVGSFVNANEVWMQEHSFAHPVLWGGLALNSTRMEMGLLSQEAAEYVCVGSRSLGNSSTPFGNSGLDLSQGREIQAGVFHSSGEANWPQFFSSSLSGVTVYAQAACYFWGQAPTGALTNVLTVQIP